MNFLKNLEGNKMVQAIRRFYSKHIIRKLFLTILCAALVIGIICMIPVLFVKKEKLPDVKSKPLSESLGEIAKEEGRILVAENGGKELYFSTETMILELVDKATGTTLTDRKSVV